VLNPGDSLAALGASLQVHSSPYRARESFTKKKKVTKD
jgi:hypothetical protein